jgi:hypothetical protein
MVKVADIIAKVEYVKEGESLAKTPAEYKAIYDKRRADREKPPDPDSPTRLALAKLQDQGLGRKQDALPKAELVGIPSKK